MTPLVLAVLAVVLSGPVPALLARTPVVRQAPRAAMTLWQAVALAAVLAALGAGLSLFTGTGLSQDPSTARLVVAGLALGVTGVVVGRLLLMGHRVGRRLRVMRGRHRRAVDLLATDEAGVLVLEDEELAAYCLPGLTRGRVVISRAAAEALTADQLAAVVAHERSHLAARHDLVLEAFTVLHQSFPRFVSSSRALQETRLLVEVLADASARRRCGALPVAQALVALADARTPGAALAAAGSAADLTARVRLLSSAGGHGLLAAGLYAAAVGVLALPTLFVALPWLTSLTG